MTLRWQTMSVSDAAGNSAEVKYAEVPEQCPICHVHITAQLMTASLCPPGPPPPPDHPRPNQNVPAEIVFRCNNRKCGRLFIATYDRQWNYDKLPGFPEGPFWVLVAVTPVKPVLSGFSAELQNISPTFIEIYGEASSAEAVGLQHIAGMGFRKALEFLVKDFLIRQRPADKNKIERVQLGTCIENYVDEPSLKLAAERATWLGNDETHYVRVWPDKDLKDLKVLLGLTVNWIDRILLTEKYSDEMKRKLKVGTNPAPGGSGSATP